MSPVSLQFFNFLIALLYTISEPALAQFLPWHTSHPSNGIAENGIIGQGPNFSPSSGTFPVRLDCCCCCYCPSPAGMPTNSAPMPQPLVQPSLVPQWPVGSSSADMARAPPFAPFTRQFAHQHTPPFLPSLQTNRISGQNFDGIGESLSLQRADDIKNGGVSSGGVSSSLASSPLPISSGPLPGSPTAGYWPSLSEAERAHGEFPALWEGQQRGNDMVVGNLPDYRGDKFTNAKRIQDTRNLNAPFYERINGESRYSLDGNTQSQMPQERRQEMATQQFLSPLKGHQ